MGGVRLMRTGIQIGNDESSNINGQNPCQSAPLVGWLMAPLPTPDGVGIASARNSRCTFYCAGLFTRTGTGCRHPFRAAHGYFGGGDRGGCGAYCAPSLTEVVGAALGQSCR